MTVDFGRTKLKIGFSFFLVASLMLLLSDSKIALMCFLSSAAHELGHLFMMLVFSQRLRLISFGAFGIRIEKDESVFQSYRRQALVALGGVFVNFIICSAAALYYFLFKSLDAAALFFVNVFIAALNLMPAKSLDAWNALHCAFMLRMSEQKALRTLSVISAVTVIAFSAFCVVYFIFFGFNASLTAVCIYLLFLELRNGESDG